MVSLTGRQVCKHFRKLVEGSIGIQYRIECAVYGVVDGDTDAFPVRERLSRLRGLQKAWRSGKYTQKLHITIPDEDKGSPTILSGSILAHMEGKRSVHITQIPSKFRDIPEKKWVVPDLPFNIHLFDIDHSQRLLLALED